jgi:hypothetical protein
MRGQNVELLLLLSCKVKGRTLSTPKSSFAPEFLEPIAEELRIRAGREATDARWCREQISIYPGIGKQAG